MSLLQHLQRTIRLAMEKPVYLSSNPKRALSITASLFKLKAGPFHSTHPIHQSFSMRTLPVVVDTLLQHHKVKTCHRAYTLSNANNITESLSSLARDEAFESVIKQVYETWRQVERSFFMTLSDDDLRLFGCERGFPRWGPVAVFRSFNEVLFTLKGLKPCTLFIFHHPDCLPVFSRMVQTRFKPIFDTHQLERYGFTLRKLEHDIPTEHYGEYKNAWILADTQSEEWNHVQKVFMKYRRPQDIVSDFEIGRALGYPIMDEHAQLAGPVIYDDPVEKEILKKMLGIDIHRVVALDYRAPPEQRDYQLSRKHFERYRDAVQSVGGDLLYEPNPQLDFGKCQQMHEEYSYFPKYF